MTNYLRPDELTRESEINRSRRRTGDIRTGLETVSSLSSANVAAKAASKVIPFLSQYIPEDLALKGINKVSPAVGNFLKGGVKNGLSLESGLDFLRNEFSNQEISQESAKENLNVLQRYSDKIHHYIKLQIESGNAPRQAAAKAKKFLDKKEQDIIKKLEEDEKTDFGDIVESIFGKPGMALKQQNQPASQAQQQPQGQGLNPQLAQLLQEGNQILKNYRGQP